MAHFSRPTQRHAIALDEVRPNQFLIRNMHINSALKHEGTIKGRMFELTTWRREGLLARLRERGYQVRTIADRIAALPQPPAAPPIGGMGWRALTSPLEQISHFDLLGLHWHALTPAVRDGASGVVIYDGWVLRRRKGRGPASFYLAAKERAGGIGLRPLDEVTAVLMGIAQALEHDPRPLLAERRPAPEVGNVALLPAIELPPVYREVLALFTTPGPDGALVDEQSWPQAQALFGRLGVMLTIDDRER